MSAIQKTCPRQFDHILIVTYNAIMSKQKRYVNQKQSKFVDHFLSGVDPYKAAVKAGYSLSGAGHAYSKILQSPTVMREIERRTKKTVNDILLERAGEDDPDGCYKIYKETVNVDAEWVLARCIELYEMAKNEESLAYMNKALELIGKHKDIRAFEQQKTEITINTDLDDRLLRGRKRAIEHTTAAVERTVN